MKKKTTNKPPIIKSLQERINTQSLLLERKQADIEHQDNQFSHLRDKFTRVLKGAMQRPEFYPSRSDSYSWEEIFCEVGKLLMFNRNKNWEENIDESLRQLWSKVNPQ